MKSSRFGWPLAIGLLAYASGAAAQQPPDYPMWCHGSARMAQANGKTLIVDFKGGTQPAGQSLAPGVCSWLDRGLRTGEPNRIVDVRPSAGEARITASHINDGAEWTFWVYNAGNHFNARVSSSGLAKHKPVRID